MPDLRNEAFASGAEASESDLPIVPYGHGLAIST